MDFNELAHRHCTDKQKSEHNYMDMYAHWLANRPITKFLEIGLGLAGSARMWHEAFPDAEIWIIDIAPTRSVEHVNIVAGAQECEHTWHKIPDGLDVIIDDGSHHPRDMIASFNYGFPKLKPGGLFFIEDTHCAFHPNFNKEPSNVIYDWLFRLILEQQSDITSGDFYKVHTGLAGACQDIYAYHCYKSVILIEKAL